MSDIDFPQVMLDLETMGTSSNAAIIAIGAQEFDLTTRSIGDVFYTTIDLASTVEAGGVMDASTVLWWMQQSEGARDEFKRPGKPILRALEAFADWMDERGPRRAIRVWGNGAAIDNVILASAYRRQKLATPWEHWNDRCYRTVKNMFPDVKMERNGTHHNALDDAESQARHLIAIYSQGDAA